MVIGAIVAACVLLVVLAFLLPRLSRGPERIGGSRHAPANVHFFTS